MKNWTKSIAAVFCMTAVSLAADNDAPPTESAPASRMPVALPQDSAKSSASIARERSRSWIPAVSIPIAARTPRANAPVKEPAVAERLPAPYAAAQNAPGRPQMVQGPRVLIAPSGTMLPRIPNLLGTNKRAAQGSGNPVIMPAAPISTPPVSNLEGTSDLPRLPPMSREIQIEIAPLPAPLPFDREPYVQSPAAPDDADAPARSNEGTPGRVVLK